jgi:hypothetical protein
MCAFCLCELSLSLYNSSRPSHQHGTPVHVPVIVRLLAAGNLCRHSAFFYEHLNNHGFIACVIERCTDSDPSTRKFACFALGNAAFHSDSLYSKLALGIRPIVALLNDANPKTRLNAVGALGNMVRSGEQLVPMLMESGAVQVYALCQCFSWQGNRSLVRDNTEIVGTLHPCAGYGDTSKLLEVILACRFAPRLKGQGCCP